MFDKNTIKDFNVRANSSFVGKMIGYHRIIAIMRSKDRRLSGNDAYIAILCIRESKLMYAIPYSQVISFFRSDNTTYSKMKALDGAVQVVGAGSCFVAISTTNKDLTGSVGSTVASPPNTSKTMADNPFVAPGKERREACLFITSEDGVPEGYDEKAGDHVLSLSDVMAGLTKMARNDARCADFIRASINLI